MFNLLMSSNPDDFQGEPWTLERNRVFEYTTDVIAARFKELSHEIFTELCSIPALIAYERGVGRSARIGKIDRIRVRQAGVRIEYSFIEAIPEITPEMLNSLEWELDIEQYEPNRTHWAIKDVDLVGELSQAGLLNQEHVTELLRIFNDHLDEEENGNAQINPTIFRVPDREIDINLVSVMMPFQPQFNDVFATIDSACAAENLRAVNANQVWEETEIIQEIFSLIYRSKIVVCDFTDQNANVFYEAGIAHTLGRHVVPIVQRDEDIPFDLRHHRYLKYDNDAAGRDNMRDTLVERLAALKRRPVR